MDSDGEENALIKASLDCDLPALVKGAVARNAAGLLFIASRPK